MPLPPFPDDPAPANPSVENNGNARKACMITDFPEDVQDILKMADKEGDGQLSVDELKEIFGMFASMKEAEKQGNVSIYCMPKEIQHIVARFDLDGGGSVSPIELARAADMYEASKTQARRLKKLALGLVLLLVLSLTAMGILVFSMAEATKETELDSSGAAYVKGSNTVQAKAVATKTGTLFDAPQSSLDDLKAVNSLTLSDKAGTTHYGYTITGYTKDNQNGAVTFFSSRGDKILATASKVTVTAKCTPQGNAASCTGRMLLELSKSDVEGSRRLREMRVAELTSSAAAGGRRLSSSELRRLQLQVGAARTPGYSGRAQAETDTNRGKSNEVCPDGTRKVQGAACPEPCEGGYPQDCDSSSRGRSLQGGADPVCECPTMCPDSEESCYSERGGMVCDQVRHPFKEASTACIPKCTNWRDAVTGNCMAQCIDPNRTEVMENQLKTHCPVECPDLRLEAAATTVKASTTTEEIGIENAASIFGEVWAPDWVLPTESVPAEQATDLLCPRLCPGAGYISHAPQFYCPHKCYNANGDVLLHPDTGKPVLAMPDAQCPRFCPATRTLRWGDYPCPIYCPDSSGNRIWDDSTAAAMEFQPKHADGWTVAEIREATCPTVCPDGSVDLLWMGCTTTTTTILMVDCPGQPKYCGSESVIQVQYTENCPATCPTLRNCWMSSDGLIWPGDNKTCPTPCYNGDEIFKDAFGDIVFDWGEGCPGRCPAIKDGNGVEIEEQGLSFRRLSSGKARPNAQRPKNRGGEQARRLVSTDKIIGWWFPPVYACPLVCTNTDGSAMVWNHSHYYSYGFGYNGDPWANAGYELILPIASKWDREKEEYLFKAVTGSDDELRAKMCPIKCPGHVNYFLTPDYEEDAEGYVSKSMKGQDASQCPVICPNGKWVWPAWGQSCEGAIPRSAYKASTRR